MIEARYANRYARHDESSYRLPCRNFFLADSFLERTRKTQPPIRLEGLEDLFASHLRFADRTVFEMDGIFRNTSVSLEGRVQQFDEHRITRRLKRVEVHAREQRRGVKAIPR